MEQHAIPQQISSYQFRLVGDMTLKQFFQLAGGALVSLLFYASKLPALIKWPFIIGFALLGVALAFLPFQERPLERWIIAFFRSIYSPTIFAWTKGLSEKLFQDEPVGGETGIVTPATEKAISPSPSFGGAIFTKLEDTEKNFLGTIGQLFGAMTAPTAGPTTSALPTPQPPQKKDLNIPMNLPTQIGTPGYKTRVVVEETPQAPPPPQQIKFTNVAQTLTGQKSDGQQAQFSIAAAPPNPPTTPNTVVGQVFDPEDKIVSGAILEIRDAAGRPVRALRSNMLGHFMIVTPLANGRYDLITEKEGLVFNPASFEATGAIIPPIAIKAKSSQKILKTEEFPVQNRQI